MDRQTWSPQMAFSFYFKKNANKVGSSRHLIKPFFATKQDFQSHKPHIPNITVKH